MRKIQPAISGFKLEEALSKDIRYPVGAKGGPQLRDSKKAGTSDLQPKEANSVNNKDELGINFSPQHFQMRTKTSPHFDFAQTMPHHARLSNCGPRAHHWVWLYAVQLVAIICHAGREH
jgi:hypothetical protein